MAFPTRISIHRRTAGLGTSRRGDGGRTLMALGLGTRGTPSACTAIGWRIPTWAAASVADFAVAVGFMVADDAESLVGGLLHGVAGSPIRNGATGFR